MTGLATFKKSLAIVCGALLVVFAAMAVLTTAPQQAEAKVLKSTGTYYFVSPLASTSGQASATITPKPKKLVIKGSGKLYVNSKWKKINYNSNYTIKVNGSTQYYSGYDKISKKKAYKMLRTSSYPVVYITASGGTASRLTFSA